MATILLVEDDPADARLLELALEECGSRHEVFLARDGEEAIRRLRDRDLPGPDLVLLDLDLPGRTGSEILKELKEDPDLQRTPVIVLTTSAAEGDIRECYGLHANCYVRKPLHFEELVAVVNGISSFWLDLASLPAPL